MFVIHEDDVITVSEVHSRSIGMFSHEGLHWQIMFIGREDMLLISPLYFEGGSKIPSR